VLNAVLYDVFTFVFVCLFPVLVGLCFYLQNKSNKKINYVECPFMAEYCNNMIALEQCLAFGSLSSKNEKIISKQQITKENFHKTYFNFRFTKFFLLFIF
jgi:hypothetical protein